MNGWEKLSETSLPKKEDFFGNLNMEDITDADNTHTKKQFAKIMKQKIQENIMICMFKAILYWVVYLRTSEIQILKYINLTLLVLLLFQDQYGKQP